MPHVMVREGQKIVIPRMTEVIATNECEARGFLHPVNTGARRWRTVSNAVALAGTVGHHQIENYIRQKVGLFKLKLELSDIDQRLHDEILASDEGSEWFKQYIRTAVNNFLEWENDFKPKYIIPEITMIYIHEEDGNIDNRRSLKGTVDLICELDPDKMSKKAKHIINIKETSTVMLDWKTGMAKLDSHHAQLEGYDWMLDATGKRKEITEEGYVTKPWATKNIAGEEVPLALCVRLGGYTYFADAYELNTNQFQNARNLFLESEYIAKTRNGKFGDRVYREGYHCVFCPHREHGCPIFKIQIVQLEDVKIENQ